MEELQQDARWAGAQYDFLTQNCCHFCSELCEQLGENAAPPPAWVNKLASTAHKVSQKYKKTKQAMSTECGRPKTYIR